MLLSCFRIFNRILWRPLPQCAYQYHHFPCRSLQNQYIFCILLLFLLSQQSGSQSKPIEKRNHRIQRRFMWKQMDSTVDGLVERVVSGARTMKGMIGDIMPPKQGSVMDYLPTETTRVLYIIRNPHTKETKVIKLRPSKKVVKIMAITPKPLMVSGEKQKSNHNAISPEKLRHMEKEQELIAEGKVPEKYEEYKPLFMALKSGKSNESDTRNQQHNDDYNDLGSSNKIDAAWKPVEMSSDFASGYSTPKPLQISSLHTGVIDELLTKPQKQVNEPLSDSEDYVGQNRNKVHTYEVTEYTAEESVVQPYTHEYHTYKSGPSFLTMKSAHGHSPLNKVQDYESTNDKDELTKHYVSDYSDYSTQRGFVPSKSTFNSRLETATETLSSSTTEEPNYPSGYWRKYRDRTESPLHIKTSERNKQPQFSLENSWQPSNTTLPSHKKTAVNGHTQHRIQSQIWPPQLEKDPENSASSFDAPLATIRDPISIHEPHSSLSSSFRSSTSARKNTWSKPTLTVTPIPSLSAAGTENEYSHQKQHHLQYHKPRNVRQRGSIRFGDKLDADSAS